MVKFENFSRLLNIFQGRKVVKKWKIRRTSSDFMTKTHFENIFLIASDFFPLYSLIFSLNFPSFFPLAFHFFTQKCAFKKNSFICDIISNTHVWHSFHEYSFDDIKKELIRKISRKMAFLDGKEKCDLRFHIVWLTYGRGQQKKY